MFQKGNQYGRLGGLAKHHKEFRTRGRKVSVIINPTKPEVMVNVAVTIKALDLPTMRAAMCDAINRLGGLDFLVKLGEEQPRTFARILCQVLPKEIVSDSYLPIAVPVDDKRRESLARLAEVFKDLRDVRAQLDGVPAMRVIEQDDESE